MPEKFIIADQFSSSDSVKQVINPYSNEIIGEYYAANNQHFLTSAEYLSKVFNIFKNKPAYVRQNLLYKISQTLSEKKSDLAKLITDETGKPIKFSQIEIDRAILTFRLGAEESSRLNGEVLPLDLLHGSENKTGIVRRFPKGLVLGITPWNFPVNLIAHKISPALASGNVIIIKPSSYSVITAIELGKIIYNCCKEIGLEVIPVNILPAAGSQMDSVITHSSIKLISFTGSSTVGWEIKKKVNQPKVLLELGGNAAVIVNYDADLTAAALKISLGGFSQAGQSCISVQRVYVHSKIYNDFKSKIIEAAINTNFGNPYDQNTVTGPMINLSEAMRAEQWINEAVQSGAAILHGGKRNGAVLEPTILENAPDFEKVKCEEVFAPVITLDKFSSIDEAVEKVNSSKFGLQAALFTNDFKTIMYCYNNIETGGVIINEASAYRMDSMPYGGVKLSGNTREGVKYAIYEMTDEKILVI